MSNQPTTHIEQTAAGFEFQKVARGAILDTGLSLDIAKPGTDIERLIDSCSEYADVSIVDTQGVRAALQQMALDVESYRDMLDQVVDALNEAADARGYLGENDLDDEGEDEDNDEEDA